MATEKRNFKINSVCGKDDLRPIMQMVYFNAGYMYATDGHVAVKAKVAEFADFDENEVELLNEKFLHKDIFKKVLSCKMVKVREDGIVDMIHGTVYPWAKEDGKYPNIEAVIPKEFVETPEIGLNPDVAKRIFDVLKTGIFYGVKLKFSGSNKPITMHGTGIDESALTASIMPIMISHN